MITNNQTSKKSIIGEKPAMEELIKMEDKQNYCIYLHGKKLPRTPSHSDWGFILDSDIKKIEPLTKKDFYTVAKRLLKNDNVGHAPTVLAYVAACFLNPYFHEETSGLRSLVVASKSRITLSIIERRIKLMLCVKSAIDGIFISDWDDKQRKLMDIISYPLECEEPTKETYFVLLNLPEYELVHRELMPNDILDLRSFGASLYQSAKCACRDEFKAFHKMQLEDFCKKLERKAAKTLADISCGIWLLGNIAKSHGTYFERIFDMSQDEFLDKVAKAIGIEINLEEIKI